METEMEREMNAELEADICEEMEGFIATKNKLFERYGHGGRFEHYYARLVARHFAPPPEISERYDVTVGRDDDGDYLAEVRADGFGTIRLLDTGNKILIGSFRETSLH
jgi:hypothetical protein